MLVLALLVIPVLAQTNAGHKKSCSLVTLQGTYGDIEEGVVLAQFPGLPAPPYPVVLAGTVTYDGVGNVSGIYTSSLGGVIVPGTGTGTYTINPDCTYSDEITPSSGPVFHHAGTITGQGMLQELHVTYTDPWLVATGTAKKIQPGPCSIATLKGTYGFLEQGTIAVQLPGFPPPPVPYVGVGTITYDGNGNASGTFTTNIDGQSISSTATGMYTVSAACTYTDQLISSSGLASTDAGAITGAGTFQEVHYTNSGGGFVSVGTAKRQLTITN
jgi:hypothetical protein